MFLTSYRRHLSPFFFFCTNTHGFVYFTEVSGVNEWRAKLDNSNRLISIGPALGWIRREQTVSARDGEGLDYGRSRVIESC